MDECIGVQEYPLFEKGVFRQYPALFDPYFRNTPDHQQKKYRKAKKNLPRYENAHSWQVITGPGFCGSIHPGAGKVFHGIMTGATHPVYTSDCLYINLPRRVFAVSDPPGITTFARDLITRLDEYLQSEPAERLEEMINEVNRTAGTGLRDRATLALVHFPPGRPGKALTLLCGDSHLFQGNRSQQSISKLEAEANRWGTLNASFRLKPVDIHRDDFFILASDGITAIRPLNATMSLDETLLNMVLHDPDTFAYRVAESSNRIVEEQNANRTRTVFGCGDDLSVLLIEPGKLDPGDSRDRFILGGYVV